MSGRFESVQGGGPAKCTLPSAGARSSSAKWWLSIVCLCEPHVASHCGSCEQGWYKPVRVSTEQEVDQNDFNSWKYMLVEILLFHWIAARDAVSPVCGYAPELLNITSHLCASSLALPSHYWLLSLPLLDEF